jgi:hypothetical protein
MPATEKDYSQIEKYREQAASANQQAAGMEGTAFTLHDTIMSAVRADRTSRGVSKLATDTGNVMGQMVTDPNAIREGPNSLSAGGLVDPFSVNALTSNARAQNLSTLGTVSRQGLENQGSLDEVINAGANQLRARAATLQAQAESELSKADALEKEWSRALQEKQFNEGVRQFNASEADKQGSGGSLDFLSLMGLGDGGSTTPKPQYTPAKAGIKVGGWVSNAQGGWDSTGGGKDPMEAVFTDPNSIAMLIASDPKNATKYTAMASLYKGKVSEADIQKNSQELLNSLTDVQSKIKGLTGWERAGLMTPSRSQNVQDIMTGRNIVMQQVAKLIEKTRLSDKDRDFYMKNSPSDMEIMLFPGLAQKKMNSLVDYFVKALNIQTSSGGWQ